MTKEVQLIAPSVTIIIRTFNEQKHLEKLFDVIESQSYPNKSIVVVDSGSFDRTRDIARARADKLIRINSEDFTFGYSLNVGIKESLGEFVVILSAHTLPVNKDWLSNLIQPLMEKNVAMTYGRQLGVECSKFSEVEDFERMFGPTGREECPSKYLVNNANSAIRRDLWDSYKFDESLPGLEDIDWAKHWMSQGWRVIYNPEAGIHHIHEESWQQIRHRYYREAVAWRQMGLKARTSIVQDLFKEAGYTAIDFASALSSRTNPVTKRLSRFQRIREIIYFRINKNIGSIKGGLASHAMETKEERETILFDRKTNAVVVSARGKASLQKIPLPKLKPGDVLIQVFHVAVCATDLEIFEGKLGYFQTGLAKFPIVPGHEFSGIIAEVGQNVRQLDIGQPVVAECIQGCGSCEQCKLGNEIGCGDRKELGVLGRNGAYSNYLVVPARFVHKIPRDMDLRKAALCEPLAVILKALGRIGPLAEAWELKTGCAIVGVGPLGHLCAKVMKYRGFEVTGFDKNRSRRRLLEDDGIKTSDNINELSNFHLIIEVTGDPEVLNRVLNLSPANTIVLVLGLPYGNTEFSFETIAAYDKAVIGSVGSSKKDFDAAIKLLPQLNLAPYLEVNLPLRDFKRAWSIYQNGEVFKVILNTQPSISDKTPI
ncbi:MAG: alcohol dehydrogenase catalytic domain-containing protein [Pseudomonadota bacterium]|nr:alcohol dehydrogenase catalytic domain-containing protein [Pseudomonadota bacterium]